MKTALIIIDCLRYDEARYIPLGFCLRRCRSLANNTEASLATILTGLKPEEHGILYTGMPKADKLLRKVGNRIVTYDYEASCIISPSILFHPYFTYNSIIKYSEEAIFEVRRFIDKCDFILIHLMDIHDLRDFGYGIEFYEGFELVSDKALSYPGLRRPYETILRASRDAGLLKAMYRGAVKRVFEQLDILIKILSGWRIIITADHGESFIYFAHDGVIDDESVFIVPLMTNFPLEVRDYTHLDVYEMIRRID